MHLLLGNVVRGVVLRADLAHDREPRRRNHPAAGADVEQPQIEKARFDVRAYELLVDAELRRDEAQARGATAGKQRQERALERVEAALVDALPDEEVACDLERDRLAAALNDRQNLDELSDGARRPRRGEDR